MSISFRIAKLLMNISPNYPSYSKTGFKHEDFKNPNFTNLDQTDKNIQVNQWIMNDINKYRTIPFERFFPNLNCSKYFEGKTILDVGCGIGGLTMYFAEEYNVNNMIGIDCNKESIHAANYFVNKNIDLSSSYTFKCCNAEEMTFDDNMFDAVISNDTFEHVRNIRKTLIECKRVTKPGGIILLVFPSYHFPLGGGHIEMVTNTLFLEWIFSPKILNQAIINITSK